MNEFVPQLPAPDDYHNAAVRLDQRLRGGLSMRRTLEGQLGYVARSVPGVGEYIRHAKNCGRLLEPRDRALGVVDKGHATTQAFVDGSAAGLLLVHTVHGNVVNGDEMLREVGVAVPVISHDDPDELKHQLAQNMIDVAGQGIARMGETAEKVVESWEEACVPDVSRQLMFRRGVGLAVLTAYAVHEGKYNAAFRRDAEAAIADGVDWDSALRGLT